jgi:hypothetical protein
MQSKAINNEKHTTQGFSDDNSKFFKHDHYNHVQHENRRHHHYHHVLGRFGSAQEHQERANHKIEIDTNTIVIIITITVTINITTVAMQQADLVVQKSTKRELTTQLKAAQK